MTIMHSVYICRLLITSNGKLKTNLKEYFL